MNLILSPLTLLREFDTEEKEMIIIEDTNRDLMSNTNSNTKGIKSLYDLFYFKQQTNDYTRTVSKTNGDDMTIMTKSLINHFAINREKYILKTEIIKSRMVDH